MCVCVCIFVPKMVDVLCFWFKKNNKLSGWKMLSVQGDSLTSYRLSRA